jgi:hypothetical protein
MVHADQSDCMDVSNYELLDIFFFFHAHGTINFRNILLYTTVDSKGAEHDLKKQEMDGPFL